MTNETAPTKGPGHIAGTVAAISAIIIVNAMGMGDFLAGRFVTGFVVGGGTYFLIALLVDAVAASQPPRRNT